MTPPIREIHGLMATRIRPSDPPSPGHAVTVTDGAGMIILDIDGQPYPAGLTSGQARWLARELDQAAMRLDNTAKPKAETPP